MKKVFAVALLTAVLAFGYVATVLAADPVAPAINLTKSLKQKWVEITLLLGDVNAYLYEIQGKLEEASAADESTKLLAINAIRAARTIKDVFILNVVIPEINDWITEVGAQQEALIGLIEEEGINGGPSLLEVFCPPAGVCLPQFPGYARVFNRIDLKLTTIDTIFADFTAELSGELSDSIGQNIDDGDTTGETCLDPSDGSTPLDTDLSTDPETLNECLDLAEEFLLADDFGSADLALERAGQLIDDMIEPQKVLLLRKLRQVQIELTSIERELKRLQRVKIKRRPADELTQVMSASASNPVALQVAASLKTVLEEIKGLRILTKDAQYYLFDIDDELDFILDLLAQAKAEIETGATASEVRTLIDLAIEKKELTLLVDLFSLQNTIEEMIAQKADLEAMIDELCEKGKIKTIKSCFRMKDELAQINIKLLYVLNVLAYMEVRLEDGNDPVLPCQTDPTCYDVDDWLADAMDELNTAGDDYDAERLIVDIIKAMELIHEAMDKKDCILLGLSCPVEDELRGFKGLIKWILTELRFVEKLARKEIRPVVQPRPRSGELEPLAVQGVEATARELRVLGRGIASFAVQVYGLNGQLVVAREAEGSQLALSELRTASGAPLANGVYLYVVQVKGVDGQMIQTGVNKLVILR